MIGIHWTPRNLELQKAANTAVGEETNFHKVHCPPQTILEKQGELQNIFGGILGITFAPQTHCLNLTTTPLLLSRNFLGGFFHFISHFSNLLL